MELADGTKDVVDPEVRAYVSSLVTAVSISMNDRNYCTNWICSLEEAAQTKMVDIFLETTLLPVFAI